MASNSVPRGVSTQPTSPASPTRPPPKPVEAAIETHRVQPGDTFTSLAEAYYGDARLAKYLQDSNRDLGDARRLSVGMSVKIPPKPMDAGAADSRSAAVGKKTAEQGPVANPTGAKSKAKTYTVKSGDSFYSIARDQLGSANRWKQLYSLNKQLVDDDPTRLRPGQVLKLPDDEAAAGKSP